MAVDKHPSRRPTPPAAPPKTHTTAHTADKEMGSKASGQHGVEYGFRHELHIKDPNKSEMSHHFHDSHPGKEAPNEPPSHKEHAHRPGDENKHDEPG